jgi:type IV pilus biogenesis protein CpaD/CtpE
MTTTEPTPRQVAVKVSPEGDRLITSGAHYLRMSKKDLVEAAVEFYLNARREEMQAGMREQLGQLDGSRAARVARTTRTPSPRCPSAWRTSAALCGPSPTSSRSMRT